MKNGYDHHDHQGTYTYNLSVPKMFILDVPNQSPPYLSAKEGEGQSQAGPKDRKLEVGAQGAPRLLFLIKSSPPLPPLSLSSRWQAGAHFFQKPTF